MSEERRGTRIYTVGERRMRSTISKEARMSKSVGHRCVQKMPHFSALRLSRVPIGRKNTSPNPATCRRCLFPLGCSARARSSLMSACALAYSFRNGGRDCGWRAPAPAAFCGWCVLRTRPPPLSPAPLHEGHAGPLRARELPRIPAKHTLSLYNPSFISKFTLRYVHPRPSRPLS